MTQLLFVVTLGGYITFSVFILIGVLIWILRNDSSAEPKKKRPTIHTNTVFIANSRVPHTGPVAPQIGKSKVEVDALAAINVPVVGKSTPPVGTPGVDKVDAPVPPSNLNSTDSTFSAGVDPYAARPMNITPGVATVLLVGDEDMDNQTKLTDDALANRLAEMFAIVEKLSAEKEDEITFKDLYRLANEHQTAELSAGRSVDFEDSYAAIVKELNLSAIQVASFESSRQWLTHQAPTEEPVSVLTTVVSLADQPISTEASDMPWQTEQTTGFGF